MRRNGVVRLALVALLGMSSCAGHGARAGDQREDGIASYYASRYHGRPTASGETFNVDALTAAHRTLPFGTRVRVTNLNNGRSVIVRVNDRGPFVDGRVIDLSPAAARRIDMIQAGVVPVKVEVISGAQVAHGR
jgi:rare lipoprotein A